MELTAEHLRELVDYDQDTGLFRWKKARRAVKVGKVAGRVMPNGYINFSVMGKGRSAHRLAWLYVHGRWPIGHIDHINGIRDDNRIENLRECTPEQNFQNLAIRPSNSTGFAGVTRSRNKFQAAIRAGGKTHFLGRFATAEEAAAAYLEAKSRLHTFAPRLRHDGILPELEQYVAGICREYGQ